MENITSNIAIASAITLYARIEIHIKLFLIMMYIIQIQIV